MTPMLCARRVWGGPVKMGGRWVNTTIWEKEDARGLAADDPSRSSRAHTAAMCAHNHTDARPSVCSALTLVSLPPWITHVIAFCVAMARRGARARGRKTTW